MEHPVLKFNEYEERLTAFKKPLNYIGLFGTNGDYEKLAGTLLPANSRLIIYVDEYLNKKSFEEFIKICESKNQEFYLLSDNIKNQRYLNYLKYSQTFLNLDHFNLQSIGGSDGLVRIYKSIPNPKQLRCIIYNRPTSPVERIEKLRTRCEAKHTGTVLGIRRYSKVGPVPQYFYFEND